MPAYSFKKAKAAGLISEKDADRLMCLFLMLGQTSPGKAVYTKAATELGSTPHSLECMMSTFYKKLRAGDCVMDEDEDGASARVATTPSRKRRIVECAEGAQKGGKKKVARTTKSKLPEAAIKEETVDEEKEASM